MRVLLYMYIFYFVFFPYAQGNLLHQWRGGFLGDPNKYSTLHYYYEQPDEWFEQPLDHFDLMNEIVWKQRYFVNEIFYRGDSNNNNESLPIFLLIGGEGEAAKKWMYEGTWIHFAKHFRALCFYLEHRYYGKSRPTRDLSNFNLRYLSSEQALADLSAFINGMKIKYKLNSNQRWILFGGSYPGNLVAWAREKYPDVVYGAISSSAPVLAKLDFKEYFEVVTNSLNVHNKDCALAIKRSFTQIEILLKHAIGQRNLDKMFRTCTPISDSMDNSMDLSNFFEIIASNIAGVVQYSNDNTPKAIINIDHMCNVMENTTIGSPIRRLAKVNEMISQQDNMQCLDYEYKNLINIMKQIDWLSEAANGSRQWTWQTCNEFGYFQTSEQTAHTFGVRFKINYFIKQCMDIFAPRMNEQYLNEVIEKTNVYYGGLNPSTTNVLYIHGSIDPWHALGLTNSVNANRPVIYIEGGAHCSDMYEPSKHDSIELRDARNKIMIFLEKLLNKF